MFKTRQQSLSIGAGLALLSAVLFGASTPLTKVMLDDIGPWLLAAVLYLGSGIGLLVVKSLSSASVDRGRREKRLWSVQTGSGWLVRSSLAV